MFAAKKSNMSDTVLILGGTSDIGRAIAAAYAENGSFIYLAGRNLSELEKNAADITIRYGGKVECLHFDALDEAAHKSFYEGIPAKA